MQTAAAHSAAGRGRAAPGAAPASRRSLAPLACLLALATPSCGLGEKLDLVDVPGTKVWNLDQIHTPEGKHRFSASLAGDLEYLIEFGLFRRFGRESGLGGEPEPLLAPADRCLEELLELASFSPRQDEVAALQIAWFARLAVEDPWTLSRERCVLELGPLGAHCGAGAPRALEEGQTPLGPDEVGALIARLVAAERARIAGEQGASAALEEAVRRAREATLDVPGGFRVLRAVTALLGPRGRAGKDALASLEKDLEGRLVRLALARSLGDEAPRVRAAALRASVECGGPALIAGFLLQLEREPAEDVLVTLCDLVREHGLPPDPPGLSPSDAAEVRRRQIAGLEALAVSHENGTVRVRAMEALAAALPGAPTSLREEDWVRWSRERRDAAAPPAQPAPGPQEAGGDESSPGDEHPASEASER